VLLATVLALIAAVLHATWNLLAKRASAPFVALWGQFAVAGAVGIVVVIGGGGLPADAWGAAAVTGVIHVPYLAGLARAYEAGDFSLAYPIARGGGALLAGVGGIVLLDDELNPLAVCAIVTITAGMALLAAGAHRRQVVTALLVAVTIGAYTLNDAAAVREVGGNLYPLAVFTTSGLAVSIYGVVTGRGGELVAALPRAWRQFVLTAALAIVTYTLVLAAVQRAPVGYVAALRESSVLLAAFLGTRYLAEGELRRRTVAAAVILGGIVLLVASS